MLRCMGLSSGRLILQADYNHSLGICIATISANMSAADLASATEEVLSVLALNLPQVVFNNTATPWLDVSVMCKDWD